MANEWMQQLLGNGQYHHLVAISERDQARKWAINLKRERDALQSEIDMLRERQCKTCKLRNMLVGLINDIWSGDWSWSEITERASIAASEFKAWEARDE